VSTDAAARFPHAACDVGGATLVAAAYAAACVYATPSGSADSPHYTVENMTISAAVSRAAKNLLYAGSTGDAVAEVSNPNPFAVTVAGVKLHVVPGQVLLIQRAQLLLEELAVLVPELRKLISR
jgi:hypothetical protein